MLFRSDMLHLLLYILGWQIIHISMVLFKDIFRRLYGLLQTDEEDYQEFDFYMHTKQFTSSDKKKIDSLYEKLKEKVFYRRFCPGLLCRDPRRRAAHSLGDRGRYAALHTHERYQHGPMHHQCRGYYVDTVGKNEKKIAEIGRAHV